MKLIYEQEGLSLYCGNAGALTALADNSIQLVATSPPYYNGRDYSTWPSYECYLDDMATVVAETKRVLAPDGRIAINVPMGYGRPNSGGYLPFGRDWTDLLLDAGLPLLGTIIWDKTSTETNNSGILGSGWGSWCSASAPSLRDGYEIILVAYKQHYKRRQRGQDTIDGETFAAATNALWRIQPVSKKANWHPAPWPAEIARRLIELYTFRGDRVLDPFSGCGTTAWVASSLGRHGIGVELSEEYANKSAGPLLLEFQRARYEQMEFA